MSDITWVFEVQWDASSAFQSDAFQLDAFQTLANDGWTDETANVLSIECFRGRDYASQLLGRPAAGQLVARLNNPNGRYASFNASSPLYGMVVPARRVRLRATSPSAVVVWQGFLDEIKLDPRDAMSYPRATFTASGALKYIAEKDSSTALYADILTGTAIGYVLDDAGWPTGERTLDPGTVRMSRWQAGQSSALGNCRDLEDTEMGMFGESKDGKLVWEDVHHRLKSPHTVSQVEFSDDPAGSELKFLSVDPLDPWRSIFNRFVADTIIYDNQALAVLWTMAGDPPAIAPGASFEVWAQYPTAGSDPLAWAVDTWTTPAATTDFLANSDPSGSGSNLTANISVSVSKFAQSMKITLTNTSPSVLAYLTFLQARGIAIFKSDPIRTVKQDADSIAHYGSRTYPLPGKFYPTVGVAQSFVDYNVSRFKDPRPILKLLYSANDSDDHAEECLVRDVSDRITVVANKTALPGTQLGIDSQFFVESILISIQRPNNRTRVAYELSDAFDGEGGYWVLGVSQLGITTRLSV